jgi:crotonobetainyl-CoA:carnitine CoA-transferase CaiB-like acyl-CoA transferase
MADMGARVIKIERPVIGDICRHLYVSDAVINGESSIFHAINRNKESFQADIKKPEDLQRIKKLIRYADVIIHNFRPGVMERIGLSYNETKKLNSEIIYANINGYGVKGEWRDMPGQDLLLQAVTGITFLSGNNGDGPIPMGVSVADIVAGTQLVQGILAAIYNRFQTSEGVHVEVSMLESLMDFQFEVLTCYFNDGFNLPKRSAHNSGHAYIAAPYGIYKTANGFLALAMGEIPVIGHFLGCSELLAYTNPVDWFEKRDEIKLLLQNHLKEKTVKEWLAILEPADIWCAEVFDYQTLTQQEGYRILKMEQEITAGIQKIKTTRCPIKIDGKIITSPKGAPVLGEHTEAIIKEFNL